MPGYRIVLKPLKVDHDRVSARIKHMRDSMAMPHYQNNPQALQNLQQQLQKFQKKLEPKSERVIDADFAKVVDGGTLLVGIGPTSSKQQFLRGFMGKRKPNTTPAVQRKKRDHEFYDIKWDRNALNGRGAYDLRQKFEKIMSINLDNVISINGKPAMGRLDNLDQGVQQLGLDEDWSVDNISDLLDE